VFRLAGETPPVPGARPVASATPAAAKPRPASSTGIPLTPDALLDRARQERPEWELLTLRFNPPLPGGDVAAPAAAKGAVSIVVRVKDQWPPFAPATLTLDAFTGAVQQVETFADQSAGQRARRWIRLLHTGEALRWPGQLVALIGCLGGCFLVWTGFAMAWRRFVRRSPT
jgi:hypothetical protein